MSVCVFKMVWEVEEVLVLDIRSKGVFVKGFILGFIFIGLDGSFVVWVGVLIIDFK